MFDVLERVLHRYWRKAVFMITDLYKKGAQRKGMQEGHPGTSVDFCRYAVLQTSYTHTYFGNSEVLQNLSFGLLSGS